MNLTVGETYWYALHPESQMSPGCWETQRRGELFEVVLESKTPKVLTLVVKKTGVRFKQSTWPMNQLGVYRPPFKSRDAAQDYCDASMVWFDEDGMSLNKLSKSKQQAS